MLASEAKTHTKKNRSGKDVKEVEFYDASSSKAITKLIFLTFLPRFPWKLPLPAGVSGNSLTRVRPDLLSLAAAFADISNIQPSGSKLLRR